MWKVIVCFILLEDLPKSNFVESFRERKLVPQVILCLQHESPGLLAVLIFKTLRLIKYCHELTVPDRVVVSLIDVYLQLYTVDSRYLRTWISRILRNSMSIWIKNTFWLLNPTIIWRWRLFYKSKLPEVQICTSG